MSYFLNQIATTQSATIHAGTSERNKCVCRTDQASVLTRKSSIVSFFYSKNIRREND